MELTYHMTRSNRFIFIFVSLLLSHVTSIATKYSDINHIQITFLKISLYFKLLTSSHAFII